MARLWSSGFELNSVTAGMEWSTVTNLTIQTGTVRSGSYAGQITSLVSGTARGAYYQYSTTASTADTYYRTYIRFGTLPSAENTIVRVNNTAALTGTLVSRITVDNTGTVRLYDGATLAGTAATTLASGQWYCLELHHDLSLASGARIIQARLDQATAFGTTTSTATAGGLVYVVGGNLNSEAQTAGNWYFDDIAINNATGTVQNSWPGPGGIIHLRPAANAETTQWSSAGVGGTGTAPTGNYTRVNEVTPNDNTSYNQDNTITNVDLFTIDAVPAAVGATDTINLVQVGLRFTGTSTTLSNIRPAALLASQSDGTRLTGTAAAAYASTTYMTNTSTAPRNYALTSYTDPQAGGAWTKALLGTARIGYKGQNAGGGGLVRVTNVWALVEYTPTPVTNSAFGPVETFSSGTEPDTATWDEVGADASIIGGVLRAPVTAGISSYAGVTMKAYGDFTDKHYSAEVKNVGNQAITSWQVIAAQIVVDGDHSVAFMVTGGNLVAQEHPAAGVYTDLKTSTAYDSAVHKFFRIRESGGTTYWEYATTWSDDLTGWTTYHSKANPITYTLVKAETLAGCWQAEAASTYAEFDNINTDGSGVTPPAINTSNFFQFF